MFDLLLGYILALIGRFENLLNHFFQLVLQKTHLLRMTHTLRFF